MQYYEVVKFYQKEGQLPRVQRGYGRLTLEEARRICQDPEKSSRTASTACNGNNATIERWNRKQKHWFLGFRSL